MPTFTSRLGLIKQAGGEDVDVDLLNANFDRLDAFAGTVVCTSTTRPTGTDRFVGVVIYETDTNVARRWTGTRWSIIQGSEKTVDITNAFFTPDTGWVRTGITSGDGTGLFGYEELPGEYVYHIALRRTGADVAVDGNGLVAGAALSIGNVGAGFPGSGDMGRPFDYYYRTTTGGVRSGQGRYNGRTVELVSGQPNQVIAQRATDNGYSLTLVISTGKNNGIKL